jgi:hypothetical protein
MKNFNIGQIGLGIFGIILGIVTIVTQRLDTFSLGHYRGLPADIIGLFIFGAGCMTAMGFGKPYEDDKDKERSQEIYFLRLIISAFILLCIFGLSVFFKVTSLRSLH